MELKAADEDDIFNDNQEEDSKITEHLTAASKAKKASFAKQKRTLSWVGARLRKEGSRSYYHAVNMDDEKVGTYADHMRIYSLICRCHRRFATTRDEIFPWDFRRFVNRFVMELTKLIPARYGGELFIWLYRMFSMKSGAQKNNIIDQNSSENF